MLRAMVGLVTVVTMASAVPALAAPRTYVFSGTIQGAFAVTPGLSHPFAMGQSFTGEVVYDSAQVGFSWDYITQPDWNLVFHYTPLVSLKYSIETASGPYTYVVPTQNLVESANQYVAVGKGSGGWTGVDIRTQNYPVGWTAGPPSMPVPPEAYIGALSPHGANLSLYDFGKPDLLPSTSADIDLAALFAAGAPGMLDLRFSDSTKWQTGVERLDLFVIGKIESLSLQQSPAVPEPGSWALMIAGFGLVGATMRRRRPLAA